MGTLQIRFHFKHKLKQLAMLTSALAVLTLAAVDSAHAAQGRVVQFANAMPSQYLRLPRDVYVYLPPSYSLQPQRRFPVVYLHDGQNLFDPARSAFGKIWNVKGAIDRLISTDPSFPECIAVGIDNTDDRIDEYTPVRDPNENGGGQAAAYLQFIVRELKPAIDKKLRTLSDANSTVMAGSSLGGLMTTFAAIEASQVFGRFIIMSPSVWWADRDILKRLPKIGSSPQKPIRVYVDTGTNHEDVPNSRALAEAFRKLGYRDGENLRFVIDQGASHDETAWARRLPEALRFIFANSQTPANQRARGRVENRF